MLYSSLNYGFIPRDLTAFVRAVGAAVGVPSADVDRLVDELHELCRAYEWASGVLVTGGAFLWDEDDKDDADLPTYISWADVVKARYGVGSR